MSNLTLEPEAASRFARMALDGIGREYPNKLDHVINGDSDLRSPRELHPAFYGCFDWHSSVHSHWMLVRLLRVMPGLPEEQEIRAALADHFTESNLQAENAYLQQPNRRSFERTYGWAWLLKLTEELFMWDDSQANKWRRNLQPLADTFAQRYLDFLPTQTYPIRVGTHTNTAFGLLFALDYAGAWGHNQLERLIIERSMTYYANDADCPAQWEPGGNDFFSPCLMEADLMFRLTPPDEFIVWLERFLPGLPEGEPVSLFRPALVADRTDPQIVHLDGLNLSRAWCMYDIASAYAACERQDDSAYRVLTESARRHAEAALPHIASGDYMGEHWLASFAVYLLSVSGAHSMDDRE